MRARRPWINNTVEELGWKPDIDMPTALKRVSSIPTRPTSRKPGRWSRRPKAAVETRRIALKVDVDTLRGTLEGVPALAAAMSRLQAGGSFYFSLRA